MTKSIYRFIIVLVVAVLLGAGLYLTMHAIQPLADRLDPEPVETRPDRPTAGPRTFYIPELRDLIRGSLSIGKDVFVFAIMTVIVVGIQRQIPKARRPTLAPEETDSE